MKRKTNYVGFLPHDSLPVETKGTVRKVSTVAGRFIASIQCTEEEDNRDIRLVEEHLLHLSNQQRWSTSIIYKHLTLDCTIKQGNLSTVDSLESFRNAQSWQCS